MNTNTSTFVAGTAILAVAAFIGGSASHNGGNSPAALAPVSSTAPAAIGAATVLNTSIGVGQGIDEQLQNCADPSTQSRSIFDRLVNCSPIN